MRQDRTALLVRGEESAGHLVRFIPTRRRLFLDVILTTLDYSVLSASSLLRPALKGYTLLKLALLFFVISLVAGVLGFSGISSATAGVAKIMFFVAVGVFVICIALALFAGSLIL